MSPVQIGADRPDAFQVGVLGIPRRRAQSPTANAAIDPYETFKGEIALTDYGLTAF